MLMGFTSKWPWVRDGVEGALKWWVEILFHPFGPQLPTIILILYFICSSHMSKLCNGAENM